MIVRVASAIFLPYLLMTAGASGVSCYSFFSPVAATHMVMILVAYEVVLGVNGYLDARLDWLKHPAGRFSGQVVFGVCLPAFVMWSISRLAFAIFGNQDDTMGSVTLAGVLMGWAVFINTLLLTRYLVRRLRETDNILRRDFPNFS